MAPESLPIFVQVRCLVSVLILDPCPPYTLVIMRRRPASDPWKRSRFDSYTMTIHGTFPRLLDMGNSSNVENWKCM
jgi:hypothetical protein